MIYAAGTRQQTILEASLVYAPHGNKHYLPIIDTPLRARVNTVPVQAGTTMEECLAKMHQAPLVKFLTFPNLELPHSCSTRVGGVSKGAYEGLNIGQSTKDAPSYVHENRLRLGAASGIPIVSLLSMTHGTKIVRIDENPRTLRDGDGCITNTVGQPLMITTADCVPLIFFDPVKRAVAITHAGWRGTAARIGAHTVEAFKKLYGTNPADLQVGIGPSIGPCCFKVGREVADVFANNFPEQDLLGFQRKDNKEEVYVDLWRANQAALIESGVKLENICFSRICSACHRDLFFSYRRDQQVTGRMAASAMLQE